MRSCAPRRRLALAASALALLASAQAARAQTAGVGTPAEAGTSDAAQSADLAFHAQTTFVYQGHDSFDSPYRGSNSLNPTANARETWDLTAFLGWRVWRGGELWIDPEVDQGFGLSGTLGVAGFPSGEGYKVGEADPYFRVQRVMFRQTWNLGGDKDDADADLNQFAQARTANRVTLTLGKFSVGDVFDVNQYAHDPRGDFLNWTAIDAGTFDYAADAWGYSAGTALEWRQDRFTGRLGGFLLSNVPNSTKIDTRFKQFELIAEVEERHTLFGHPGKLMLTGYVNRGRMGKLSDATALGLETDTPADIASVRRYASRPGLDLNVEQELAKGLGAFLRVGWADGRYEAYEFTDVDRTLSGGLSLKGERWGRGDDTVGLAAIVNQASDDRKAFLDAGGLGILVGDGRLPHPDDEHILEAYYQATIVKGATVSLDYQHIENPAYNADRGPVNVLALRLHGQF